MGNNESEVIQMENILNILTDGGIALAVIAYFMYRDNKYTSSIVESIAKFQIELERLSHNIEEHLFKKEGD